ncbi:MAG TPA: hypothetical protein VLA31_02650 [Burkholderiaceae bacterium]|nr:hypothetical protein [Burkholderiaceae bacterium]
MAKALGTDDSINACDCCGKINLKFTVAIELDDGEIVHYGQVCARRNTGKDQRTITSEIKAHQATKMAAARTEWQAHPARIAERARFDARPRNLHGIAAMEFVHDACEAADAARKQLADKHGISAYALM